jgi:hypothetical protein
VRDALIHRAREAGTRATGERNAQGEKVRVPFAGPWVAARFMERGIAAERRRDDGGATTARGYELLMDFVDETGAPFELKASMRLLVVAPPVTPLEGWLVEVDGDPEHLNDGVDEIGWMGRATRVEDTR